MLAEYFARSGGFMQAESRVLCQIGGLYASRVLCEIGGGLSDRGPLC